MNAHTLGLIAGNWDWTPTGNGAYVYDDATARSNHVPGFMTTGGIDLDWMQWGANDSTIYANQYTTMDSGGIATVNVDSSGATLASMGGGILINPVMPQYVPSTGLLYSDGGAYDPVKFSLMGSFDFPATGSMACTPDAGLGRYYCVMAIPLNYTDVDQFELWVYDLKSYALIDRLYLGTSGKTSDSLISGAPVWMVRWGNAGLALLTETRTYDGTGGIFLIDGAAVNPAVTADSTSGKSYSPYAWMGSMTPDSATTASAEVTVAITGTGFSSDSTACWNCNFLQMRFLPTTYVSSTQLNVTIPLASTSSAVPLEISVYDQSANRFSSNALTFTFLPSATISTQVTPLNICGLAEAWDDTTGLLYVATADYDGAYPNSVVALDPSTGKVSRSQTVESNPIFLSDSANGKYLYVAYDGASNYTQLTLPDLSASAVVPLRGADGSTWVPGDFKTAPQDPDLLAATLIAPGWHPESLGGIVVFDKNAALTDSLPGWTGGQKVPALYDTLAWSASDQLLTSAPSCWDDGMTGPLYSLQVDSTGVSYISQGSSVFNTGGGYTHSDYGTNLIYSDGGSVADPSTGAIMGSYGSSGLVAPDSSLNRVFILGQTTAQANTNSYTIQSFDQKAYTLVSSITIDNLSGSPIELVRWGTSGLAVLTSGGLTDILENGNGMLYLIQDTTFVSGTKASSEALQADAERVQRRWKAMTKREHLAAVHHAKKRTVTSAHGSVE